LQASVADWNCGELVSMLAGSTGRLAPGRPAPQAAASRAPALSFITCSPPAGGVWCAAGAIRRQVYGAAGDSTVTEAVTWLSLTAWHPGGRADQADRVSPGWERA